MANQSIRLEDYTILLVDDDQDKVNDDKDQLKEYGYSVYTATSGEEAINILRTIHIDILVIDYYMDGMNGEETIVKIREFNSAVIILLQTGFAQKHPAFKMLESLKIQGYYDKFDGQEKLMLGILSATRSCEQQRELKKMIQKVDIAHYTLNEIMKDQSRMIEQVRLASLGQKMGAIFHDMSNSLSSIEGNIFDISEELSFIISELKEPNASLPIIDEKAHFLLGKCESCHKGINIIREMRNTVVAQSRQDSVNTWEKFSLEKLLETVNFFAEDDKKKYRCEINIDNRVNLNVRIIGKEVSLAQVLNNLITNSAEAYQNGGKIDITISEKGSNIEFFVRDWAGGIPLDIQSKLLKEMVTTKGSNGNGIGVYTSYLTITDYFGGTMGFESIPGRGTTFYISIPCAK